MKVLLMHASSPYIHGAYLGQPYIASVFPVGCILFFRSCTQRPIFVPRECYILLTCNVGGYEASIYFKFFLITPARQRLCLWCETAFGVCTVYLSWFENWISHDRYRYHIPVYVLGTSRTYRKRTTWERAFEKSIWVRCRILVTALAFLIPRWFL